MKDDFDERLTQRLRALDAAVPPPSIREGAMPATRSTRVSSRFPLGLAAGLVVFVAVVALAAGALRMSSNVGANESTGPSGSAPTASSSAAPPTSTTSPTIIASSPSAGMVITDAQAIPFAGTGNPVRIFATIENRTGADDDLIGASSPVAATGGLYATCLCTPGASDASGMGNLRPMTGRLIRAGQALRVSGEIVLNGLDEPLAPGDQLQVTFEFANAAPVTVTVTVVSGAN
jgi:copper(I)-binding protein